jgi:hypothetical protein
MAALLLLLLLLLLALLLTVSSSRLRGHSSRSSRGCCTAVRSASHSATARGSHCG